jgi:FAD/FMN-containing dehydrogenase
MKRRPFLKVILAGLLQPFLCKYFPLQAAALRLPDRRMRPSDTTWPSEAEWEKLRQAVGGNLAEVQPMFAACRTDPNGASCLQAVKNMRNPYWIGDQLAGTQVSGWLDAWKSEPSAYAVSARNAADVAVGVNFAREKNLRLVVKGGGHSYQGTSNAADSLLIWTRAMNTATVHEAFVAIGCEGVQLPQPAVSLGGGALWIDAYDAVTTRSGRYVQGGGCATVGVAGLIQSGGFNMFSKRYGLAAAGLLEAEVVTADGQIRVVNARQDPDLFWALKGGGGGSFGVVTRVTLRTRELPESFGLISCSIHAPSDGAYRKLIREVMTFYRTRLFNPAWGEKINLRPDRVLNVNMFAQGLGRSEMEAVWAPFFEWIRANRCTFSELPRILIIPARSLWDRDYMAREFPGALIPDDRAGAPHHHARFADDDGEVGWFIHGYQSAWLPAALLTAEKLDTLTDALFEAAKLWTVQLFFSKGLAGAPQPEIAAAQDTAINPEALSAFALAIIADGGAPEFDNLPGAPPEKQNAHRSAGKVAAAMRELTKAAPNAGSYVAESDYFRSDWQQAFWGGNYRRLLAVKARYDPDGLFYVRHGAGSEAWSADGFTRVTAHAR